MLGGRFIAPTYRLIQYVSGTVSARQAEVDQIVACGSLSPGELFSPSFEVPASIDSDGMESFGVELRRIKHDIICCTVPDGVLDKASLTETPKRTGAQYFVHA